MRISAVSSAIEYLAGCDNMAVRLHAARSLSSPRRFGVIRTLRDGAEADMFAREVRELFLLPYAEARRTDRLRGPSAGVVGPVLSSNASVAMDALLARGCETVSPALRFVLDDMLSRASGRGFFREPHQRETLADSAYLLVTAVYARYLLAFGRGRDPRVRRALEWLTQQQDTDGLWRSERTVDLSGDVGSYLLTRAAAQALAELPVRSIRRFAESRRRAAVAWADRVLPDCSDPDAVLTTLNICADPRGPHRGRPLPQVPGELRGRILYFPLEDLWLAMKIGASPTHPHLARWIEWLEEAQLADGSWRLQHPGHRERLLLSDPNGRLRAESLYLTDAWITLRAAQILHLSGRRAPSEVGTPAPA